jgi:hypothetical protein
MNFWVGLHNIDCDLSSTRVAIQNDTASPLCCDVHVTITDLLGHTTSHCGEHEATASTTTNARGPAPLRLVRSSICCSLCWCFLITDRKCSRSLLHALMYTRYNSLPPEPDEGRNRMGSLVDKDGAVDSTPHSGGGAADGRVEAAAMSDAVEGAAVTGWLERRVAPGQWSKAFYSLKVAPHIYRVCLF